MNTYRRVLFPNGTRVQWSPRGYWFIKDRFHFLISRHDSREYAITKAKKMDREVVR